MNSSIRRTIVGLAVGSVFAAGMLFAVPGALAQQKGADAKQQIVGVWKLVSNMNKSADGSTKVGSFGLTPNGRLIFTASGHYALVNTSSNIPKFASGNRMQGTPEEDKAVGQGSNANFGTYAVSPDGKTLTFKVEGGTWALWNGTEQKRDLALVGDEMKTTATASVGGTSLQTWQRVK